MRDFIEDNYFKMIIEEEKIYIKKFKRINIIDENHILLKTNHKRIHVLGEEIRMKRLVNHEVLLIGKINKIEVSDDQ